MKKWYLVLLKPGKGNALKAKEKLESMGVITFYPLLHIKKMRKDRRNTMRTVSQPLFPGYMFLCFYSSDNLFSKVECCEGVICFVRFGNGPVIIRDSVMGNIIAACFKLKIENVDVVESNVEIMEGNTFNSYDERIFSVINEPDSSLKSMKLVAMIHEMS
ncbi:hypothetical protein FXQ12_23990 [Salmonella enterica]|nr:hypothetical protein [Salmonella enterica]ECC9414967.1 hypothetical protein [Salmonella enterica subsp. enterica]EHF1448502.1 hypothetical protein [Salmonella enterica subsp. enterica serovar 4,5,12:b:-]EHG1528695.1 hypothetical protein [Salmonella enterica subsp. enterica serovar 4,[5],12:b:-]ECD8848615.1 hypothetical protein [Salmonella enterica subsp. enterica]